MWGFVHRHRIALALGAVAAACVVWLVLHARRYGIFFADDSFISLRYSQRLLQGRGLGWNDGEAPVEGYSNFLWVIGCALVGVVSKNLVSAARTLGLLSSAAAIVAVVWLRRPARWSDLVAGGVGGVAMALSGHHCEHDNDDQLPVRVHSVRLRVDCHAAESRPDDHLG